MSDPRDLIDVVLFEVKRFEERARIVSRDADALQAMRGGYGNRQTAAMRRASMDLSNALARLRQYGRRA